MNVREKTDFFMAYFNHLPHSPSFKMYDERKRREKNVPNKMEFTVALHAHARFTVGCVYIAKIDKEMAMSCHRSCYNKSIINVRTPNENFITTTFIIVCQLLRRRRRRRALI